MGNLTKKDETTKALSVEVPDAAWGTEGINQRDTLIPKLLLMQSTSDLVGKDKAKLGDLVNSVTGKILAGKDKTVTVIPILSSSTWELFDLSGAKPKYLKTEQRTPDNEDLDWKGFAADQKTGLEVPIKRVKAFNCFVLLLEDALKEGSLPYAISFRSTNLKEGKKIATHFNMSAGLLKPPARTMFKIGSTRTTDKGNTWALFTIEEAGTTPTEAMSTAYTWYKTIQAGAAKIDVEAETRHNTDETDASPQSQQTRNVGTDAQAEF